MIEIDRSSWFDIPQHSDRPIFAIGDCHGVSTALKALLEDISTIIGGPHMRNTGQPSLVTLGDYIDRGPNSLECIDLLIEGVPGMESINLAGNHEQLFYNGVYRKNRGLLGLWTSNGGIQMLQEMKCFHLDGNIDLASIREALTDRRLAFLEGLRTYYREGNLLFVHAGILPSEGLDQLDQTDWRDFMHPFLPTDLTPQWIRGEFLHHSTAFPEDVFVIHGHTPYPMAQVKPNRVNLDCGSFKTGKVACLQIVGDKARIITAWDREYRR